MSLINWFEENLKRRYPVEAKEILEMLLLSKEPVNLRFQFDNHGTYEVLDFKLLKNIQEGQTAPMNYEDGASNPYFVTQKMISYIEQYVPEELKHTNILPFARATFADKTKYIYFIEETPYPFMQDINWIYAKPIRGKKLISKYIKPDQLLHMLSHQEQSSSGVTVNNRIKPQEIIPSSRILITDGECVDSVNDYKHVMTSILNLTNNRFILSYFNGKEQDGIRTIELIINGQIKGCLSLEGNTDWIDPTLISQLNTILKDQVSDYRFIEFRDDNWGQEFGVAFANDKEVDELATSGFIKSNS